MKSVTRLFFNRCLFFISTCLFFAANSFAQTNPTPQLIPYSQDFGLNYFNTIPTGFAAWNSGTSPNGTVTSAGNSVGVSDQTVDTAQVIKANGDVYGYSGLIGGIPNNDGELYIQTSSNTTQGTCQLVLAINTTGYSLINVTYDVDMVNPQPKQIGVVFQYRVGTVGAWTTIDNSYIHNNADRVQYQFDSFFFILPAPADNQPVVQLRWATARYTGIAGNSSGIALDNIVVNGTFGSVTPLYYRSVQSGNWNNIAVWESSPDNITWSAATRFPTNVDNTITIRSPHVVTTSGLSYLVVDEVVVDAGATFWNSIGTSLSISNGPTAVDLDVNGTMEDSSATSVVFANNAKWRLGANANFVKTRGGASRIWQISYYNGIGTIPANSNWYDRKPATAPSEPSLSSTNNGPPNPQATYGNLYIENYSGTWTSNNNCFFRGSANYPLIKGNLYIGGNGTGNVAFLNQNINASPILVMGDVIIKAGSSFQNSGTGIEIQGNLTNDGTITYVPYPSKILFSGSNAQTISGMGAINESTFQVNKPSNDLTVNQPVLIDGSLLLTNGRIYTQAAYPFVMNDNAVCPSASNTSFVSGPISKLGDDAFTFPVGKNNDYQSIGISAGPAKTAFWTENFNNGCTSNCTAVGYTSVNGTWTQTLTGTNDASANNWYVSSSECGNAAAACQSSCAGDASLHIGSTLTTTPDSGASYTTAGLVTTNKRIESPVINCTGRFNIIIDFVYIEGGNSTTDNAIMMYYNGTTWSQFTDLLKTAQGACGSGNTWTSFRANLPVSSFNNANVKIGFQWTNDADGSGGNPSFAVDDINLTDQSDAFTAEYFHVNPQSVYGNVLFPPVNHISQCEYWTLTRDFGTASKKVTLAFDGNSCGINNLSDLRVVRYNTTKWIDEGNTLTTGTTAAGTITSGTVSGFGPFTLGSITTNNPLPISLLSFDAKYNGKDAVDLNWSTAIEVNNDFFTVERSSDGYLFEEIANINGAGNSTDVLNYSTRDLNPLEGISYYRLRQTDFDRSKTYSQTVAVNILKNKFGILSVAHQEQSDVIANIFFPENGKANLILTDMLGQNIYTKEISIEKGLNKINLLTFNLPKGVYFLKCAFGEDISGRKFIY